MLCLAKAELHFYFYFFTHCRIQVLRTVHTSQGQQVIVICSSHQPPLWSSVAGLDRQCMRCCYLPLSCSTDSWDWCWDHCPKPLQSYVAFCWALLDTGKRCQMPLFMALMCCRLRHQDPPASRKCVLLLRVNCQSKRFFVWFCFVGRGGVKRGNEHTCLWTETPPDMAKWHKRKTKKKAWAFDLPTAQVITVWVIRSWLITSGPYMISQRVLVVVLVSITSDCMFTCEWKTRMKLELGWELIQLSMWGRAQTPSRISLLSVSAQ